MAAVLVHFAVTVPEAASSDSMADRPRALLLGDSNMGGALGQELECELTRRGFEVHIRARSSSGLARPDYFDWIGAAADEMARHDPALVVMIFGGNDVQNLLDREGRLRVRWSTGAPWFHEYVGRIRTLLAVMWAPGRQVFLLSPTNRAPRRGTQRLPRVLAAQRFAVEFFGTGAVWIDTWGLTSDPGGRFLARGPGPLRRRLRRADGIHLNREGARALLGPLMGAMADRGLRPAPR